MLFSHSCVLYSEFVDVEISYLELTLYICIKNMVMRYGLNIDLIKLDIGGTSGSISWTVRLIKFSKINI